MRHLGKIKKVAIASVLAVSMVVSMFSFWNVNGRNGPKKDKNVFEEEGGYHLLMLGIVSLKLSHLPRFSLNASFIGCMG